MGHTLDFYFEVPLTGRFAAIVSYLVLAVLLVGIKFFIDKYVRHKMVFELSLIIILSLVLRLLVVVPNTLVPFSDFNRVWEMVHGYLEGNIEYYSLFPAYLNYTVLLKDYLGIVGDTLH